MPQRLHCLAYLGDAALSFRVDADAMSALWPACRLASAGAGGADGREGVGPPASSARRGHRHQRRQGRLQREGQGRAWVECFAVLRACQLLRFGYT
jgi:hypothetical protein